MYRRLLAGLILLILVVILTLQNAEIIVVRFLFWEFLLSRALLIFIVFAVGIITGWFLRSWGARKQRAARQPFEPSPEDRDRNESRKPPDSPVSGS